MLLDGKETHCPLIGTKLYLGIKNGFHLQPESCNRRERHKAAGCVAEPPTVD